MSSGLKWFHAVVVHAVKYRVYFDLSHSGFRRQRAQLSQDDHDAAGCVHSVSVVPPGYYLSSLSSVG